MKMSSVLAAAMMVACASTVMAEDAAKAAPAAAPAAPVQLVTGDAYVGPASKYLFRGNNLSASGDFVIQGGVDLTYKDFTFSYWTNAQNRNVPNPSGDPATYKRAKVTENDIILNYAVPYKPLNELVSFNIGTQYYAMDGVSDTNEFYAKAAVATLLTPTFAVYWDNLNATKAGLFYTASLSQKIELNDKAAFTLGGLVGYNQHNPSAAYTDTDATSGIYTDWHNFELSAALDYKVSDNVTITPSYLFSNALSDNARAIGIRDEHVVAVRAMFAF